MTRSIAAWHCRRVAVHRAGTALTLACLAACLAGPRDAGAGTARLPAPALSASRALSRLLAQTVAAWPRLPGLILRVESPRIGLAWSGATGLADRATGRRLAPGDAVRVASVTKTFTAAAALRLVEQGRVALDAPITRYLPEAYTRVLTRGGYHPARITMRHLLWHTAGLFDYAGTASFDAAVRRAPGHRWTRLEQVRFAVVHGHPLGQPGEAFHYSDTGYVLLGAIVERASHLPLAAAFRTLLGYSRLGLSRTYLETLEAPPHGEPPRGHQYYAGLDMARVDASFDLYGGGGLVSTMADLTRFFRALLRGEVFTRPATLQMMIELPDTNTENDRPEDGYAMGIFKVTADGTACWGHDGAWGTFAFHCPALDLSIAASYNVGDVELDERTVLTRIVRLVRAGYPGISTGGRARR